MLLVYAYHTLDYPSPYKTKHEKQGFKIVTLIPADTSTTHAPKRSTNVRSLRLTVENNQTKTTTPASFTATLEETEKARVLGSISSYTRGSTFLTFLLLSCLFVQSKVNFWTFHPIYFCCCYSLLAHISRFLHAHNMWLEGNIGASSLPTFCLQTPMPLVTWNK